MEKGIIMETSQPMETSYPMETSQPMETSYPMETSQPMAASHPMEALHLYEFILENFSLKRQDIRTYSPLALAFIGDGIYDLVIRSIVVGKGNTSANCLHKKTSQMVKAQAQSEMIEILLPSLTEEEEAVYRRGRNAKSPTMAKNASILEYRRATGFEALMGYLYLKNEFGRLVELVKQGLLHTGRL